MNVFRRMKDIITSNVNSALDRMEDPEKMIDLSIRQLQDAIAEMKAGLAEKRQELGSLEREIKDAEEGAARWAERAELAVAKDLDDMAREAITEKMKLVERKAGAEENLIVMRNVIATTEANIEDAVERLEELKATSGTLKARARLAKDRVEMNKKAAATEDAQYARRMEELKAKIERWEEEANISFASASKTAAEPGFRDLERDAAVEKELEAIRSAKSAPRMLEEN